jgi:hypothetical protein
MNNVIFAIPGEDPGDIYIPLAEPVRSGEVMYAILDACPPEAITVTFPFAVNGRSFKVTLPASREVVVKRMVEFWREPFLREVEKRARQRQKELADYYADVEPRADGRFEG